MSEWAFSLYHYRRARRDQAARMERAIRMAEQRGQALLRRERTR